MGIVVAIVLLVITAILVWIVNDASRLRKRGKIKLRKKNGIDVYKIASFRLVAIGASMAFLPAALGMTGYLLGYNPHIIPYPVFCIFFIQSIGALIMCAGFFKVYNSIDGYGVDRSGFILAITGSLLGFIINLHAAYVHRLGFESIQLQTILFIAVSGLMAVACLKSAKIFTRFKWLGISFIVIVLYLLWFYTCWHDRMEYGGPDVWEVIIFPETLYILSLILITAACFSFRLSGAKPKGKLLEAISDEVNEATIVDAKKSVEYEAVDNSTAQPSTVTTSTDDSEILTKLMGYDNERLRKIVATPRLYNPVVVEKAGKLLARREAWEEIKDLPDEELLGMTMADKGLYDENVVEAASMELYQRGSEALRGQFMALTPDVVAAIAGGTASAPEGIRLAAKDFLDKHLRR